MDYQAKDFTGITVGTLRVERLAEVRGGRTSRWWLCVCTLCGRQSVIPSPRLNPTLPFWRRAHCPCNPLSHNELDAINAREELTYPPALSYNDLRELIPTLPSRSKYYE